MVVLGDGGAGPWEWGWDALAAVATTLAVIAAFGLHYLQRWHARRDENERKRTRTQIVAPEIAADVMAFHHQLGTVIRAVVRASERSPDEASLELQAALSKERLTLTPRVGGKLNPSDFEAVVEDVRLALGTLRGRAEVNNAIIVRTVSGPFAPHKTASAAVVRMLPDIMVGLVAIHQACVSLLEKMQPYMEQDVATLYDSVRTSDKAVYSLIDKSAQLRARWTQLPTA